MGDHYFAIADVEARPDERHGLAQKVVRRLVAEGIIQPLLDPEATLGNPGYRPGNRIKELFSVPAENHALQFWSICTNGMEVCSERWVNMFGFICLDDFVCPRCAAHYSPEDPVAQQFGEAIGLFLKGNDQPLVHCPACGQSSLAAEWSSRPHFGFTHLAFVFWNWPPFDSSAWTIDIPKLVSETLHHRIVVTYGRM
jgi:hypothetical protein